MAGATLSMPTNLTNTLSPIANATTIPSIVASDVSVNFDRLVIVPITCFVLGLACENAVSGLVANMVRIAAESDKKKYFSTVFNIITIFNLLSIVYNSLFLAHYLLNESNCSIMDFVTNIFAQSYYVIFDSFMLYKTWTVSGYNKVFFFIMCVAILNRICWGCVDLKVSSGSWRNHHCEFRQNPITGAGNGAADILSDIISTLGCIYFAKNRLRDCFHMGASGASFKRLLIILVQENVLRSIVVLTVNSFVVWSSNVLSDGSVILLFYAIESYVFVRALNLEYLWIGARQATAQSRGGSPKPPAVVYNTEADCGDDVVVVSDTRTLKSISSQ